MFENSPKSGAPGRTLENELDEVNEKIAAAQLLVGIGAIGQQDEIPEGYFDRIREIAAMSVVPSSEIARLLTGIEYIYDQELLAGSAPEEVISDIKPYLADLIENLSAPEFPHLDEKSINAAVEQALVYAQGGQRFADALLAAVATRKETMGGMRAREVHVDAHGVVLGNEELRQ